MAKFYDTLLWEYIKNPWVRWLSLDDLASKYFDYKTISYDEITSKKKTSFEEVDLENASIYSWEDVYITYELYKKQIKEEKDLIHNLEFSVLYDIEIPLLEVLKDMELTWVKIDRDKLKWIWILLENEISKLEKEIYNLAWVEFNIKSPKQVWEILFEKLWLKATKKTKTWYSVNSEVLEWLARNNEIAKKIIDYRTYTKLLSTYVDWLLWELDENNIIHTSFNQTITSTWRLSSTNPNLQNIPVWEGIAWEIREAFIPFFQDEIIMTFDYSQVEVRVLAIMSGDENLLNAFKNNLDIHQNTAKFLFWKDNISKNERKIAKAVNFWVIYWISAFWLSKMIDSWVWESKKYIDKFYENYPKVREFFDKIILDCQEKWYVETLFWRKRIIQWINDRNKIIASAAQREAINMPIQWTAADIIKLAMIEIHKFLQEKNLKSKMIMQVHDELVFSVFRDEKEILKKEIKSIMENILNNFESKIINYKLEKKQIMPLLIDVWIWKNWWEAK